MFRKTHSSLSKISSSWMNIVSRVSSSIEICLKIEESNIQDHLTFRNNSIHGRERTAMLL